MQDSLDIIAEEVNACKKCPLYKHASHGVSGEGPANSTIFFIGQAPGASEDASGRPFVGRAGQYLVKSLEAIGLSRSDVFITSTVKHFPPKNRAPTQTEIAVCRPFLIRQLELVRPKIVVLLGKTAESLASHPALADKIILVTVHPSAAMRFPLMAQRMKTDFLRLKKLVPR